MLTLICPECKSPVVSGVDIPWCAKCHWPANQNIKHFHRGMRVRYVPHHAFNDPNHDDCEDGIVTSPGKYYSVFVLYDIGGRIMDLEDAENYTSKATPPEMLVNMDAANWITGKEYESG